MFRPTRTKRPAPARTPASLRRHLYVTGLEDRSVPSVSAVVIDGNHLVVTGSQTGARADQIRVIGDPDGTMEKGFDVVRVFDGAREVAAFAGVRNISVRPGGNSATTVALNGYDGVDTLAVEITGPGSNSINIGSSAVNALLIRGAGGSENITVKGVTAGILDADAATGFDQFHLASSAIKELNVRGVEAVDLGDSQVGVMAIAGGDTKKEELEAPASDPVVANVNDPAAGARPNAGTRTNADAGPRPNAGSRTSPSAVVNDPIAAPVNDPLAADVSDPAAGVRPDTGTRTGADAGTRTNGDAGTRTSPSAPVNDPAAAVANDPATGARPDAGTRTGPNAGTRTGADAGTRTNANAGTRSSEDAGTRTKVDAGTRTNTAAGTRTKIDNGLPTKDDGSR